MKMLTKVFASQVAMLKVLLVASVVVSVAKAGPMFQVSPTAAASISTTNADQPVQLGVFMESLCPDSKRFFVKQLVPTYRQIGQIIAPELVPFGHARTLGNNKMICQHGEAECQGNRRMACVQARAKDMSQQIETIGCLFKASDSVEECLAKNMPHVSYQDIVNCTSSSESYDMMLEAEKKTGRVGYVPHLTINGKSGEELQHEIEFNLKETICNQYTGTKPAECGSSG